MQKLSRHGVILAMLALALAPVPGYAEEPQVKTEGGVLSGVTTGPLSVYLGIPFAAPPTGPNRWRPPHPAASWTGVRSAKTFGSSCWQPIAPRLTSAWSHEYVVRSNVSEDCLYLNVWTPARGGARLPVLVWIHGGGFLGGSGSVPIYDGAALANQAIVVVTFNYRLGVFGFLGHPELTREAHGGPAANYGLQDQIAALQWVHRNIAAFGGDPGKVTIAGQSAGSVSVHDLMVSPLAKGLFRAGITQSGLPAVVRTPSLAEAERTGLEFAREKKVSNVSQLRALSAEELGAGSDDGPLRFLPVIDGVLLPDAPTKLYAERRDHNVPMLTGMTGDEASAIDAEYGTTSQAAFKALLEKSYGTMAGRFAALYPDHSPQARAQSSKDLLRDRGLASLYAWSLKRVGPGRKPVYAYLFTHVEPGPQAARYGAFHSSEIPYVFATLDAAPERGFTAEDRHLSAKMMSLWANFVKTCNPNGAGLPSWPKLDLDYPRLLLLDSTIESQPLLPPDKLQAMRDFIAQGGQPNLF